MLSTVLERFTRWIDAPDEDDRVRIFRRVFAALWLAYDLTDLAWGMTERSRNWFPHPREGGLVALQLALVASGGMLVLGRNVWAFGMAAAVARGIEARRFFSLNDFHFASVIYLLLAHSEGGPFVRQANSAIAARPPDGPIAADSAESFMAARPGRRAAGRAAPKWVRDVLLVQLAWIYLATGVLKLNPDWLGGGHLFVRTQYLALVGWPYPEPLARALGHLAVDATLAKLGAVLEIALGLVLLARRGYRLGVGLALGIHGVGTLLTNVWFFSASMIAAVALLLPQARFIRRASRQSPRALRGGAG